VTPARRRVAIAAARVGGFAASAVVMTFPRVDRLATQLPGDGGDAMFNYWALRWGADRLPHLYRGFWSGPIFAGHPRTMAYSESHLGLSPFQWILEHVLANPVLAMNLIGLALWTISCEATYRLARRLTADPAASLVAALAFTYSTIRLGQYFHFHLDVGALIPLVILLALRAFERHRIVDAVGAAVAWAVLTLSSSYYGILLALTLGVLAIGQLLHQRRHLRRPLLAVGAMVVTMGVLVGPAAAQYLELQRDPAFRRNYEPQYAARLGDFRHPSPSNRLLADAPILRNDSAARSSENYAFPGFVTLIAGAVGVAVFARRRSWQRAGLDPQRRRELALIALAGVLALLLAFGRELSIFGWHPPALYDLAVHLPGFRGVRVLVRMVVLFQLALALMAAVGLHRLLLAARKPVAQRLIAGGAAAFVLIESALTITTVSVPRVHKGDADEFLSHRPPGVVLELPLPDPRIGAAWAYTEGPRMALATDDFHPRVNGYSGFYPPEYPALAATLQELPGADAQDALCALHVRYLVLRTAAVPTGSTGLDALVTGAGTGALDGEQADLIALGMAHEVQVNPVHDAVVVELDPSCGSGKVKSG
jgi:hypothetical protein